MLNRIIRFALDHRALILILAVAVIGYGLVVVPRLEIDIFPDLNRPVITIFAEAPGLAPEEVEALVAQPLESLVNGATDVERVRSVSSPGLALLYVEFDWDTDIYRDRQIVAERLQLAAGQLPAGVQPTMAPITSLMGEIMLVGLVSSGGRSPLDLRTVADWTVRPRLLAVPGVAQVTAIGGRVAQYQVLVRTDRLPQYGLSLTDVEKAVAAANLNTPGGYLVTPEREFLVRNLGSVKGVEDLEQAVVATRNGVPIMLKDVARVALGAQVTRGDAGVNGSPGVILSIQKQPGADTLALTAALDRAFDELATSIPSDVRIDRSLFRQARFIEVAIGNVRTALGHAILIVAIVLFLFLLNVRTTAITLTAIPLSLLVTGIVMYWFGLSVNTMTLGGLAIAVGELVDDAIVDVENVFRRVRENRVLPSPRPVLQVVFDASSEVRNSIVFATIIIVVAFLPLFFLSGIEGRMFASLGVAYIVSILASLAVSLTLTPVLCSYFFAGAGSIRREADTAFVGWLKRQDVRLLRFGLRRPVPVLVGALVCFLIAVSLFFVLGREFLPPFAEGTLTVNLRAEPGISLDASNVIGRTAERALLSLPEAVSTGRRTGRAELDEHAEGVNNTEIDVVLRPSPRSREEILQSVRDGLTPLSGVTVNVGQPISHRLDHILSGVQAQVAIKVFGPDLSRLAVTARDVEAAIRQVPGVVDVGVEQQTLIPQVQIRINRAAAARYGLQVAPTNELLATALNGRVVSQVIDDTKRIDLLVRLDEPYRNDVDALKELLVDGADGTRVPLAMVADVSTAAGPNQILRENAQRRMVVQCNIVGRDLASVIADIRRAVDGAVTIEPGYFVEYGGQFESQQRATRLIGGLSALSVLLIFGVLYGHFRSARLALQIMASIPLAVIGGVVAIVLTGGTLSVASLVGFITVAGISARNNIMMLSHYLHLMESEGEAFDQKMILRGSLERLVPVLMTALTAGLAVLPLVLARGVPGSEILHPVAVVILGGLVSVTLLDQLVTPALFYAAGCPPELRRSLRVAPAGGMPS
ncbi:MAG: efflux RND transporter permease subunit [Acidobacteria bacterium]|nr:efflux RND transporter permease subunit [Acidobacteriota bacterium]